MQIVFKNPANLRAHPILDGIPELPYDCPEREALRHSVREHGILQPLLIVGLEVVDGRHRLDTAQQLSLPQVPCVEVTGPLADVVIDSLTQRRHYSKSALALAAMPLMEAYVAAGHQRKFENLKNAKNPMIVESTLSVLSDSYAIFGARIGVSRGLIQMARDIYKKLEKLGSRRMRDDTEVRDWVLEQVYNQGMGLGTVLQALAAIEANTDGITQRELKNRERYDYQVLNHFKVVNTHFERWDKFADAQKIAILEAVPAAVQGWPEEMLTKAASAIRVELQHRHQDKN